MGKLDVVKARALRSLRQLSSPIRPDKLRRALDQAIGQPVGTLLVHSGLSNCGHFTAGPDHLIDTLGAYCQTLCLPTFSYCYPESPSQAGPLFDAGTTPSKMGLLTERFRIRPKALRSIHATHSLAVSGPFAQQLCHGHYQLDAPCGAGSPFGQMIDLHASVLMIGVTFSSYTLYHTAEDASGSAFAYERGTIDRLRVLDEAGQPRDCPSRRQSRDARRFQTAGDLLEQVGLARRVALGHGFLRYVPDCAKVHDFLVQRLRRTPDYLFESSAAELQ